jgi:hypothetical protein
MKKNSTNQKLYIKMFTTSILRCFKKKSKYLQEYFTYFQVLASSLKNHDYNNLSFEVHANKN